MFLVTKHKINTFSFLIIEHKRKAGTLNKDLYGAKVGSVHDTFTSSVFLLGCLVHFGHK